MRFHGANNELHFDKWNDLLHPVGAGGGIGDEIDQVFFAIGIGQGQLIDATDNFTLNDDDALWVWAHGNRNRDAISAGPGEVISPGGLAEQISGQLNGLAADHTGHIIVWSCWGGALGGFVEHFAALMQARGFDNLQIWGCTSVTGMMTAGPSNQWACVTVYAGNDMPGLDLAGGGAANYGGAVNATQANLRGFGPGLAAPHARAFDV